MEPEVRLCSSKICDFTTPGPSRLQIFVNVYTIRTNRNVTGIRVKKTLGEADILVYNKHAFTYFRKS